MHSVELCLLIGMAVYGGIILSATDFSGLQKKEVVIDCGFLIFFTHL